MGNQKLLRLIEGAGVIGVVYFFSFYLLLVLKIIPKKQLFFINYYLPVFLNLETGLAGIFYYIVQPAISASIVLFLFQTVYYILSRRYSKKILGTYVILASLLLLLISVYKLILFWPN